MHCAKRPDRRADRPHRPDHVPLWYWRPLRATVFEGIAGSAGRKYNLLALISVIAALVVALGLGQVFGLKLGHTLGLFAGSLTSTPTLQAALDAMHNSDPSIGYSVAYPFSVIGPILCIYFMTRRVDPKFPPKSQRFHMGEITLGGGAGRTLNDISNDLPSGVQITMVRKGGQNLVPSQDLVLVPGNGIMVVDKENNAIAAAAEHLGKFEPGLIVKDRSALDYIRVFVSKASSWGYHWRSSQCPPAFRLMSSMFVATTWTLFRPRFDVGIRRSSWRIDAA